MSWLPWVRARRRRLRAQPLTEAQRQVVARHVPIAARLPPSARQTFEGLVQLFLSEKTFEGCGGLEMTDPIRTTIAASAVLLLLGMEVDEPYPGLDVIRVYPGAYRVPVTELRGSIAVEGTSTRLGESSRRGYLVLSWDDVLQGCVIPDDGHNVVLHEFAHQLDTADGVADGAPPLPERSMYGPWARVLGHAAAELAEDVRRHHANVLDPYGTTNPAEFFAVATEAFFERPGQLEASQPELYAILASYYRQDPARWIG